MTIIEMLNMLSVSRHSYRVDCNKSTLVLGGIIKSAIVIVSCEILQVSHVCLPPLSRCT